jgi:hypothetical protein
MGTTFSLHHVLFPCTRGGGGGKSWTSAQTNVTYPPPYFGAREFKYASIFFKVLIKNFACEDFEKIWGNGGGNIFFWKTHTIFGAKNYEKKLGNERGNDGTKK